MTQVAPGHHSALQDNLMSLGNGHQPWESLELKVIFLMSSELLPFLHSFLAEDLQCCVQDAANKAGLDYRIKWHRQPKQLITQVIGVVCCQSPMFINSLSPRSPRLKNVTNISNDSHMDGQLKNSSSLASRTSMLMHIKRDILKNSVT